MNHSDDVDRLLLPGGNRLHKNKRCRKGIACPRDSAHSGRFGQALRYFVILGRPVRAWGVNRKRWLIPGLTSFGYACAFESIGAFHRIPARRQLTHRGPLRERPVAALSLVVPARPRAPAPDVEEDEALPAQPRLWFDTGPNRRSFVERCRRLV